MYSLLTALTDTGHPPQYQELESSLILRTVKERALWGPNCTAQKHKTLPAIYHSDEERSLGKNPGNGQPAPNVSPVGASARPPPTPALSDPQLLRFLLSFPRFLLPEGPCSFNSAGDLLEAKVRCQKANTRHPPSNFGLHAL